MKTSLLIVAALALNARAEMLVIQGENAVRNTTGAEAKGWGNEGALSGGQWIFASIDAAKAHGSEPKDGWLVGYEFTCGGEKELWGAVGYEFVRAPMEWRVDDGKWTRIDPKTDRTVGLRALGDWCEVGWLRFGALKLAAGKHRLEIRFPKSMDAKGKPDRILFGLDAFVLADPGEFRPDLGMLPGAKATDDDRAAAKNVFRLPAAKGDGTRTELELSGLWEYARWDEAEPDNATRHQPVREIPKGLAWRSIKVPGDRNAQIPADKLAHRFFYRTRLAVPESYRGGSVFLDFERANLISSVFVNGKFAGFSDAAASGFRVDVSSLVRPGADNEIVLGFKDVCYALSVELVPDLRGKFNTPLNFYRTNQGVSRNTVFPMANSLWAGLLERVKAVATPSAVYVDDVYLMPSVEKGELRAEVTVKGAAGAKAKVSLAVENGPRFADRDVTLGKDGATFEIAVPWKDARRWSPEDPHLYKLVATVAANGGRDVSGTEFGFRQWKVEGTQLTLNGVPWQMRATCDCMSVGPDGVRKALADWKACGQSQFRMMHQNDWGGLSREQAFSIFDRAGVPVRTEAGFFDGQVASYGLADNKVARKQLFENWYKQLAAGMRRFRNHACIYSWQLENEIIFINTRNFGLLEPVEPFMKKGAELIESMDRQGRPVAAEGGRALMDQSLRVNGCHYEMMPIRQYPEAAYSTDCWKTPTRSQPWPMDFTKPIFLNEEYFARGEQVSYFAEAGGEVCYLGRGACREAASLIGRMMSEGFRWQGLAGWHFWLGSHEVTPDMFVAWQPTCALVREWDRAFLAGTKVRRTVMVRNDNTFDRTPIDFSWTFGTQSGKARLEVPPGGGKVTTVELPMPAANGRKDVDFTLVLSRNGKEVFRDVKRYTVFPAGVRKLSGKVAFFGDAKGAAYGRLVKSGLKPRVIRDFADIAKLPADELLVVGDGALDGAQATDPVWASLAESGRRMLVLEQPANLHYQAVSAEIDTTDDSGSIAFPQNLAHPAFAGLVEGDFRFWGADNLVYLKAFTKPESGASSLVQCGPELKDCALAESNPGDGLVLISQLALGAKLAANPVAARLFDNLVAYALGYRPLRREAFMCLPKDARAASLAASGLRFARAASAAEAMAQHPGSIVIADGSAAALKDVAASGAKLDGFFAAGGYLMVCNVGDKSLAEFNRLAGTDFILRRGRREKVEIPVPRNPLLSGLSQRDVTLFSGDRINSWTSDRFIAYDMFTSVVDLDEVAPFARGFGIPGDPKATMSVVNGILSAENWKYIVYQDYSETGKCPDFSWTLARPERITSFSIAANGHYNGIRKFDLVFDDDPATRRSFGLEAYERVGSPRTDFAIEPAVKASKVTLVPTKLEPVGADKPVTGIDNIWIGVERSKDWREKVVPLLNVGGLVLLPRGKGGIILNQIDVKASEEVPDNVTKKRNVVMAILRNLGAVFAVKRELRAGDDLDFRPVSFEGLANLYLDSAHGFPDKANDLSRVPPGDSRLAGVKYHVRDFRTSPLESAISLKGLPGLRNAPETMTIPVDGKADALFFLHAYNPGNMEWKPRRKGETEPAVFEYEIRYADGKSEVFPVIYGKDCGPWKRAGEVSGLKRAPLAWRAQGKDGMNLALYSSQWNNPHPEKAVKSVVLRYGKDGRRWGQPIVLGISAATRR